MSPSESERNDLDEDTSRALGVAREVYEQVCTDEFGWNDSADIRCIAILAAKVLQMRMSDADIKKRLIVAGKIACKTLKQFKLPGHHETRGGSGLDMPAVCTLAVAIVDKLTGEPE